MSNTDDLFDDVEDDGPDDSEGIALLHAQLEELEAAGMIDPKERGQKHED